MRRRTLAGLLIAAGAFACASVFCGLLEFIVRRTQAPLTALDAFVTAPEQRGQVAGENTGGLFEGDALLGWRLRPGVKNLAWDFTLVTTNAQSLRMERDLSTKAAGTLRIACFGDSVTFGYRVPLARSGLVGDLDFEELAYPALLARRLGTRLARPVEAIPFAVPGYSTHQGLAWLRRELPALGADVVTLCYGWNDASATSRPDRDAMPRDPARLALRRVVGKSQLALRLARHGGAPDLFSPQQPRVSREEYVANLLGMARRARDIGARVLVVAPVYRDATEEPEEAARLASYRDALRDAAAREGVAYLEIPQLLESAWPANRPLFGERIHPNARGHAVMAEAIADALGNLVDAGQRGGK